MDWEWEMRDQLSVCIIWLFLELMGVNYFETAFRIQTKKLGWDQSPLTFKLISFNSSATTTTLFIFLLLSLIMYRYLERNYLAQFCNEEKEKKKYTFCKPELVQIRATPTVCGSYNPAHFLNFIISTWCSVFTF